MTCAAFGFLILLSTPLMWYGLDRLMGHGQPRLVWSNPDYVNPLAKKKATLSVVKGERHEEQRTRITQGTVRNAAKADR
jgi:hypothetical protein